MYIYIYIYTYVYIYIYTHTQLKALDQRVVNNALYSGLAEREFGMELGGDKIQ